MQKTNFLIESNSWEHRTEKFAATKDRLNPRLVVRRGTPFEIKFTFQREYNRKEDIINLVFTVKGMSKMLTTFKFSVNFSEFLFLNKSYDKFCINRSDAESSSHSKTTQVTVPVFDDRFSSNVSIVLEDEWSAKLLKTEGFGVSIEISSPPTAIIGEYKINVDTRSLSKGTLLSNPVKKTFILLFNPWNKGIKYF